MEPAANGPSWVLADVRGAVEVEHEANAEFHEGPDHWAGIEMKFTLSSSGEDALGRWRTFRIVRYGSGGPGPGTYPLLRFDLLDPEATGTPIQFTRTEEAGMRHRPSAAGPPTITASPE